MSRGIAPAPARPGPELPSDGAGGGGNRLLLGPTGFMYVANTAICAAPVPALDPHADHQWRRRHLRDRGGLQGGPAQGPACRGMPNVICSAGDGGTADIGLQALRGYVPRARRALHLLRQRVLCQHRHPDLADDPYGANTTFTPPGARVPEEGEEQFPKDLVKMVAAGHPAVKYLATSPSPIRST